MLIGTNHFKSIDSAVKYYSQYHEDPDQNEMYKTILNKIDCGEIFIGKPDTSPGEKIVINISEGRYFKQIIDK